MARLAAADLRHHYGKHHHLAMALDTIESRAGNERDKGLAADSILAHFGISGLIAASPSHRTHVLP